MIDLKNFLEETEKLSIDSLEKHKDRLWNEYQKVKAIIEFLKNIKNNKK